MNYRKYCSIYGDIMLDQSHSHANEIGLQPTRTAVMYKRKVRTAQGFSLDR
jgi:hypothetical protein